MNNTPSLNEINKNSTMNPNMLTKYYKLKLMNDFMNIKYQNPKMTQSEISSQLNMSPSTIQLKLFRSTFDTIYMMYKVLEIDSFLRVFEFMEPFGSAYTAKK